MYYVSDFDVCGGVDEYFRFTILTRNNNNVVYLFYFSNHGLNYGNTV